jgi:two-component system osmolarity sensor histidine kinase EnvZ
MRSRLPRSLFGRVLLMLLVPLLAAQAVSIYIFYDRHWQTVSRRLALGLAGEIAILIDARALFAKEDQRLLTHQAASQLELETRFEPGAALPPPTPPATVLERSLAERLAHPFTVEEADGGSIAVHVQLADGVLTVVTTDKRVFSTTIWLVTAWTVGVTVLVLVIAILFLRSLIRPIARLAEAADAFGAGRDDRSFRPSGAVELRQAATAFIAMRDRIERQLRQRNEMLSGVSHDLRAPLARLRAGLDDLGDDDDLAELRRDVEEMGKMLDGYLAFIGGQAGESAESIDLAEIAVAVVADARRRGRLIALDLSEPLLARARPNAVKRCLGNLVDNALRHAATVRIGGWRAGAEILLAVDDDGPGIPPARRGDALRPFVRLDPSRNPATGGTGLGLAIAREIAQADGGALELADSPLGGLRAVIRLPAAETVAEADRIA